MTKKENDQGDVLGFGRVFIYLDVRARACRVVSSRGEACVRACGARARLDSELGLRHGAALWATETCSDRVFRACFSDPDAAGKTSARLDNH